MADCSLQLLPSRMLSTKGTAVVVLSPNWKEPFTKQIRVRGAATRRTTRIRWWAIWQKLHFVSAVQCFLTQVKCHQLSNRSSSHSSYRGSRSHPTSKRHLRRVQTPSSKHQQVPHQPTDRLLHPARISKPVLSPQDEDSHILWNSAKKAVLKRKMWLERL